MSRHGVRVLLRKHWLSSLRVLHVRRLPVLRILHILRRHVLRVLDGLGRLVWRTVRLTVRPWLSVVHGATLGSFRAQRERDGYLSPTTMLGTDALGAVLRAVGVLLRCPSH